MAITLDTPENRNLDAVLRECIGTLKRVAGYRLPDAMNRRLLELSESKETLTLEERDELHALVDFSQDRTVEKVEAQSTLKKLDLVCPHLFGPTR